MKKIIVLGDKMKIKKVLIENIGNISSIIIPFGEGINVICGKNGIGKSTIINCLTEPFFTQEQAVGRKFNTEIGAIEVFLDNTSSRRVIYKGNERNQNYAYDHNPRDLIKFTTKRSIDYRRLESIRSGPNLVSIGNLPKMRSEITDADFKNWLIHRYFTAGRPEMLKGARGENFELMLEAFSVIDPNISFQSADSDRNEVIVKDRGNQVVFEFLSEGFKAILFILLGMIQEIEMRFDYEMAANKFEGTILIDEIDLHLHPTWQREIVRVLRAMFPKTQFILTTHSPSVLQDLDSSEIIPLDMAEDYNVRIKQLNLSKYGLKGWSLEEILSDVMGVEDSKSDLYRNVLKEFETGLTNEDVDQVKKTYKKLDKMLHPQNPMRQILSIQMVGLEDD